MRKNIAIIVISILLIAGVAKAATYIGQNIYTEGGLTVMGISVFHGGVDIKDTGYLRLPVVTTRPDKYGDKNCNSQADVGKVVVLNYPGSSPKIFICYKGGVYEDGVTPFFVWGF